MLWFALQEAGGKQSMGGNDCSKWQWSNIDVVGWWEKADEDLAGVIDSVTIMWLDADATALLQAELSL